MKNLVEAPVLLNLTNAQLLGVHTALEHMNGLNDQVRRGGPRPYPDMTHWLSYWVTRSSLVVEPYVQAYSDTLDGQLARKKEEVQERGLEDPQLTAVLMAESNAVQNEILKAVVTRVPLWPITWEDLDHPTNNFPPFVLRGLWPLIESERYLTLIPGDYQPNLKVA